MAGRAVLSPSRARTHRTRCGLLLWASALLSTVDSRSPTLAHARETSALCADQPAVEPLVCGAIAFRHIPKTGGTTMREGFLGMSACGAASWTYVEGYRGAAMTTAIMKGRLNRRFQNKSTGRSIERAVRLSARLRELRLTRIAPADCAAVDGGLGLIPRMIIESHAEQPSWTHYRRTLPAARAAWPRCRFVTVAIVREPLAHVVSEWAYFQNVQRKYPRFADYLAGGELTQAGYLRPDLHADPRALRAEIESELSAGTLLLGVFEEFASSVLALAHELGVPWAWHVLSARPKLSDTPDALRRQAHAELNDSSVRARAEARLGVDRWLYARARAALEPLLRRHVRVGVRGARSPPKARCRREWVGRTYRQIAADLRGQLAGVRGHGSPQPGGPMAGMGRRAWLHHKLRPAAVEYVIAHQLDMCERQPSPACAAVAPSLEQLGPGVRWP